MEVHSLVPTCWRGEALSVREHSTGLFRKTCRRRLYPQLAQIQPALKNSRSCFEGPFGEVIRRIGPMAKANQFLGSHTYQDDESGALLLRDSPGIDMWLP